MYNIRTILVTSDFSEYSVTAMDYAVSLARRFEADIHILHVLEGLSKRGDDEAGNETEEEAGARLREAQERLVALAAKELSGVRNVVCVVRKGSPDQEIVRYARDHRADLIVIATHGRTGVAHVVIGSIAEKVVRHSPVAVMAVKPLAFLDRLITDGDVERALHIRTTES